MNENRVLSSVLVVDDDRSNLDVLAHILKPLYTVQVAKSGMGALKRAHELQPDLILLDIVMPDMNGFEVLAELKAADETRHIPVIFITGLNHVEDEEKGFLLGAVDYIVKPFKTAIVKARVRTHLRIVRQMRTIEKLCLIDALTDIPNRRSLDRQLEIEWGRAMRNQTPLSLLVLDVDRFKNFNDTYGHPQGDVLLQYLAQLLSSSLKRPADFTARMGGEEFAVLLPDTHVEGAQTLAEEIRIKTEAMRIPYLDDTPELSVTVSIGVACLVPGPGDTLDRLVADADNALYAAKKAGRNRVSAACSETAA